MAQGITGPVTTWRLPAGSAWNEDHTASIQAAINGMSPGVLHVDAARVRIDGNLVVSNKPVKLRGRGRPEHYAAGAVTGGTILMRHEAMPGSPLSRQPMLTFSGPGCRGGGTEDLAFDEGFRFSNATGASTAHPDPSGPWTGVPIESAPDSFVVDVREADGGLFFENIGLYRLARGIRLSRAGRCVVRDVQGDPTVIGMEIERAYDVPEISDVHFWDFHTCADAALEAARQNWRQQHGQGIIIRRADGLQSGKLFFFGYHAGVVLAPFAGVDGHASSAVMGSRQLKFDAIYADFCRVGLVVQQARAVVLVDTLKGQMERRGNWWAASGHSALSVPWGAPIVVNGDASHAHIHVQMLGGEICPEGLAIIQGAGNVLQVDQMRGERLNQLNRNPWYLVGGNGGELFSSNMPRIHHEPALGLDTPHLGAMRWFGGPVRRPAQTAAWVPAHALVA